jgi:Ca2+-binding RTX toxin-like protein
VAATFSRGDLEHILNQILMAEAGQPPLNPHLASGLREVGGTNNNSVPGQTDFGAADRVMPRVSTPIFQTVTINIDGTMFDPNPGIAGDTLTTSYAQTAVNSAINPATNPIGAGWVVDAAPRLISNLIVDQSANNPAAVQTAQEFADQLGDGYTVLVTNQDPASTTLFIGNITPDAGLSAPFNSWMTLFGQFFDHGLDLVGKGGSGTVFIPLLPDDPLITHGADGIAGTGDEITNPAQQFMVMTRATNLPGPDGKLGTADDIHENKNSITPFVDQNQTYASHPSHQVFLREYIQGIDGQLHSTGRMLGRASGHDGILGNADDNSSMATWADVKANALKLGIILGDFDVGTVPLLATDAYGNFLKGANGFAQLVMKPDATHATTWLKEGTAAGITTAGAVATGHAFLNDIAHHAAPGTYDHDGNPATPKIKQTADADPGTTNDNIASTYDDEMLNAHYMAGDGRVNENIGLIAVHSVFHDEHNRLLEQTKALIRAELAGGDTGFASLWVLPGANLADGIQDNEWNGERLFQVAKFGAETQYQHLVFEEFARKVAPTIHLAGNTDITLDPAIVAEFAHSVYRFGHSMLTESVPRFELNADGTVAMEADGITPKLNDIGLIQAFLNPVEYAKFGSEAAAQIIQGTTHQIGSEIDEFTTGALRNNLVGLPLDLAAINIARGRDTGVAPLNVLRAELYALTNDQTLKPYANWAEFTQYLKHAASVVNFVAAYGTHASILSQTTIAGKRAAALDLVTMGLDNANKNAAVGSAARNAYDFMHSLGNFANDKANPIAVKGQWSTGSITGLDNIDLWIGGLAEKQNLFGGLLGSTFNFIFETQMEAIQDADRMYYLPRVEGMHWGAELENSSFSQMIEVNTGAKHLPASIFLTPEYTVEAGTVTSNPSTWLKNPVTGAYLVERLPDGTVRFLGDDNFFGNTIVLGGTEGDDRLQSGHADDDTVYGDGGDDWIDGGNGNDFLFGGAGDDIIVDSAGDDVIRSGDGNDTVYAGIGDDLIFGGDGDDYIESGASGALGDAAIGGLGNDIIIGDEGDDGFEGNEGDDWLEGGAGGDGLVGDTGAPTGQVPLFAGNDVLDGGANGDKMVGFSGDDIMLGMGGFDRFMGKLGFDWASFDREIHGISADMEFREFIPNQDQPAGGAVRDFFIETEGVSGTKFNDFIKGTEDIPLGAANVFNELTNFALIENLSTFFAEGTTVFTGGNIMLGGDGSDVLMGRAGNDVIDGDAWLHVALTSREAGAQIIREIRFDLTDGDTDTAVFRDVLANYTITEADAEGFITVTHNAPVGVPVLVNGVITFVRDDADRVRNIERLQFADQTISIDTSLNANAIPTGVINILGDTDAAVAGVDPAVNNVLTLDNSLVADADGIAPGSVAFKWQMETVAAGGQTAWIDIAGATGLSFTPTNFHLGSRLRVVESFTDGQGVQERVISAPTNVVQPDLTKNTAPFIVPQQGLVGLPDTAARVGYPINLYLPLATTFGDNETASNLLQFNITLANGQALSTVGLTVTMVPDAVNGGFLGARITGTVGSPGPIEIKVTATDRGPGAPLTAVDRFLINVQTGNLAPIAASAPEVYSGFEDVQRTGTVLPGSDPEGQAIGYKLVQGSALNGKASINSATGAFIFKPDQDFTGEASFQYVVTDGLSRSAPKTVKINFLAVNDGTAPVSITGTAAIGGTLSAVIGVDPDGAYDLGTATYKWYRDGVEISGATTADLILSDTDEGHAFSVKATYVDAQGFFEQPAISAATAPIGTVTVTGVEGALVPTLLATNSLVDPDGGPLADSVSYIWELSADGSDGSWVAANPDFISADTLTLTLGTDAVDAFVKVTIIYIDGIGELNFAASEAIHYLVDGDTGNVIVGVAEDDVIFAQGGDDTITAGLCPDYVDAGAGDDTIIATGNDGNDTYIGGAGIDTLVLTGAYSDYTFAAGPGGSFIVTDTRAAADGVDYISGIENLQFSNITVSTLKPTAVANTFNANEDTTLNVNNPANGVLANDTYLLPLTAQLVTNAARGNVTLNPNGTFTYVPTANFAGVDSFTYRAVAGTHLSDPVTVTLNVAPVNDGNGVVTITGLANQGETLTAVVSGDPDGTGPAPVFEWRRNGVAIAGQTASTYIMTAADVGARISVAAAYVDGQGFSANIVSAQTAVVTASANQTINGDGNANTLVGAGGDDTINGNGGNDTITGRAGADIINGNDGNDTFFATINDGNDTYNGGAGTDTYSMVNTTAPSTVNLLAGTATSAQTGTDTLTLIENVTGSAGDNLIIGNAGVNVLVGNAGNDTLDGGTAGADALRGGTGNVSHIGMTLTELANEGFDTVQSSITLSLSANIEKLVLTGAAAINATGNNDANVLVGNSANNVLSGLGGNDTVDMSATTSGVTVNLLTGQATGAQIGTDTLQSIEAFIGGSGNDTFIANATVVESFTGGLGADTFAFQTRQAAGNAATRSVITDFVSGTDKIDLRLIDANQNPAAAGIQAFLFEGELATGVNATVGRVGYHFVTIAGVAHTVIDGNVQLAGLPDTTVDFQIDLIGHIALTSNDFILT